MSDKIPQIAPKVEDAKAFLTDLLPEGPWLITYIHADKDQYEPPQDSKRSWKDVDPRGYIWTHGYHALEGVIFDCVRLNREVWNVYIQPQTFHDKPEFIAGMVIRNNQHGPSKVNDGHVKALPGVWVDVDAADGETTKQAKARAIELARTCTRPVRAIVDSGNGIQIHWRLSELFSVETKQNRVIADAVLRGMQEAFNGDGAVAHVGSLMRLPGFVNWPNKTKLAKGRVPVLAHLVDPINSNAVVDILELPQAEKRKPGRPKKDAIKVIDATAPLNLDALEISDELKVLIRTGEFTDEQKAEREKAGKTTHTRSQVAYTVTKMARKEKVALEVLKSLYLDESYGYGNGRSEDFESLVAATETETKREGINNKEPDLKRLATQIEQALSTANVAIYRRDNDLVRIVKDKQAVVEGGVQFEAGTSRLLVNDWDNFRAEASHVADFYEEDSKGMIKYVAPSLDVIKTLKGTLHERSFPVLEGISHVPSLVCDRPGYDAATRRYYDFTASDFMKCPARPTREDAFMAADYLLQHTRDMTFKDEASRSAYLAALLTAANRPMFRTAPLFGISANQPGLAKSKLSVCLGYLAMGREIFNATYHGRKDEDSKQYLSMLRAGRSFICWDNVEEGLLFNNDQVNTGLQSAWIEGRILGESRQGTFSTCAMHVVNGNNLRFTKDITRRTLMVSLYTDDPKWTERHFDFDPVEMVKEQWPVMIVATHVILRAFQLSGVQYTTGTAFGGFEDWSNLVRGAVRWLHMDDPLETNEGIKRADPDKEALATILVTVASDRLGRPDLWVPRDLGSMAQDVLGSLTKSGTYSEVGVGKLISRYVGRVHEGIKLEAVWDPVRSRNKYRVVGTPSVALASEIESHRDLSGT